MKRNLHRRIKAKTVRVLKKNLSSYNSEEIKAIIMKYTLKKRKNVPIPLVKPTPIKPNRPKPRYPIKFAPTCQLSITSRNKINMIIRKSLLIYDREKQKDR